MNKRLRFPRTRTILAVLLLGLLILGSCSVLKKNSCGCPPMVHGKMH